MSDFLQAVAGTVAGGTVLSTLGASVKLLIDHRVLRAERLADIARLTIVEAAVQKLQGEFGQVVELSIVLKSLRDGFSELKTAFTAGMQDVSVQQRDFTAALADIREVLASQRKTAPRAKRGV